MTYRHILITALTGALMLIGAQAASADMDRAKPGNYPGGLPCTSNADGAIACFQARGDKVWVKDTAADFRSAVGVIHAYRAPGDWEKDSCRNKLKAGSWGYCNYQFKEDHQVTWWAVEYDAESGAWLDWSPERFSIA
jgi:hypothetical protein